MAGDEGELDLDGNFHWSYGALELLQALECVLGEPEAAQAFVKVGSCMLFGVGRGTLELLSLAANW